jgi:N utilization substance protein B
MLNRRILRIKVFKVLYSYAENPSMSLKEAEAELEISCQAVRDLYLYMLSLIPPLTAEASARIDAARAKFNPTEEERHPNLKFVENRIAPILEADPDFKKLTGKKKFSWDQNDAFLRKLYERIRDKEYFQAYLNSGKSSLREDAALFVKIFEEELVDNPDLEAILEEMSIYWIDDLAYALTWCCRSIESLGAGHRWEFPPLYQSEIMAKTGVQVDSDREFAVRLLRGAFTGYDRYYQMIAESVPKWDKDRLFVIDAVLVITGLAEVEHFPEIPNKISVNEYVEISKYYSTPKSRSFVNGLLDNLIKNKLSLSL